MSKLNYINNELAVLPEIISDKLKEGQQPYGVRTELLKEIVEVLAYLKKKLDMPSTVEKLTGKHDRFFFK